MRSYAIVFRALCAAVLTTVACEPSYADWLRVQDVPPTISTRVHAVFVADDDGSRKTPITPAQVKMWVDKANEIYAGANIHLDFDPSDGSGDFHEVNSTLINSVMGTGDSNWVQARNAANGVAAQNGSDLVVFFRWGNSPTVPTGAGFSWTDYNFIAMPAFDYTTVGGHQNITLFAHEAGHYLGLAHTFGPSFSTVTQAEQYYVSNGQNPRLFDGDGRADTFPDPYVSAVQTNTSITSLNLAGTVFPLPRSNIMSYYEPHGDVSSSQAWTLRQTLLLRSGQRLEKSVTDDVAYVYEAELVSRSVTSGFTTSQGMQSFLGRWSGNTHLLWLNGGLNAEMTFNLSVPSDGQYAVFAGFTAAPDFGVFTHTINGQTGSPLDLYSAGVIPTGAVDLGLFELNEGSNQWIVRAVGSNPAASPARFGYGLDYVMFVPVPEPDGHMLITAGIFAFAIFSRSRTSWR